MHDAQNISAFIALILAMASNIAAPAEKPNQGRVEYTNNCLNCHGQSGDGNGPNAPLPNKSKNNGDSRACCR